MSDQYCVKVVMETSKNDSLYQRITLEQFAHDPNLNMDHQMGIAKSILGWAEQASAAKKAESGEQGVIR